MAQPPSPPPPVSLNTSFPSPDDLDDIQGDIILGIPKRFEEFIFFKINTVEDFKSSLKLLIPSITTTSQIQALRREIEGAKHAGDKKLLKVVGTQISFTSDGLRKLGVPEDIKDPSFLAGQLASAKVTLEDPGVEVDGKFVPKWLPAFIDGVDGLISVAGDSKASVDEGIEKAKLIFGKSFQVTLDVEGNVRPGKNKGHEHFGFMDGISLPAIPAITGRKPGQQEVSPGVILCGQPGDEVLDRPKWTKNGSIVVYRHLKQLVPEFNKFLHDYPIILPGLPREKGSELLGARMIGRWKSGAPIELRPLDDDPELAKDPNRNNFFDYDYTDEVQDQTRCPFAAHIRKTAPRSWLRDAEQAARRQIMRSGIPFGPEVTQDEHRECKTKHERGLSFVCYQSNIADGFEFMQKNWCNNDRFPFVPRSSITDPNGRKFGQDPIVGQNRQRIPGQEDVDDRFTAGLFPDDQERVLKLPEEFVVSQGGAYLFAPSISALKTVFVE